MGRLKKVSRSSFTLIEMIVVVGISGLILPVLFAIVFAILQQQTKIIRLQQVKREGDFATSTFKSTIRNFGEKIYSDQAMTTEVCSTKNGSYGPQNGATFFFKDKAGNWFNFYLDGTQISSGSALFPADPVTLTSSKVTVSSFTVGCTRKNLFAPPAVQINLTIDYNTSSTRPEDTASLNYKTNIKLKNY